jgi:hypothetical protein
LRSHEVLVVAEVAVAAAEVAVGDGLRWELLAAAAVGPQEEMPPLNVRRHGNRLRRGRM